MQLLRRHIEAHAPGETPAKERRRNEARGCVAHSNCRERRQSAVADGRQAIILDDIVVLELVNVRGTQSS